MIAYLAGPYRAKTINGIARNIARARKYAEQYWKEGYTVICPHLNSSFMDGLIPDEEWLDRYLALVLKCDVIIMMPGWQLSAGSRLEWAMAYDNNIPAILIAEECDEREL